MLVAAADLATVDFTDVFNVAAASDRFAAALELGDDIPTLDFASSDRLV